MLAFVFIVAIFREKYNKINYITFFFYSLYFIITVLYIMIFKAPFFRFIYIMDEK